MRLQSVVVSVMLSETKVFSCHKFPDWTRWLWLLWALLPSVAVSIANVIGSIRLDFITGLTIIAGLFVPVGLAAG